MSLKTLGINSVGPGYIKTPLLDSLDDSAMNALIGLHPIGRLGTSEVAALVLWPSSGNMVNTCTMDPCPMKEKEKDERPEKCPKCGMADK